MKRWLILVVMVALMPTIWANHGGIIAGVSGSLYVLQEVVRKVCILSGVAVFFCGIMRFFAHRKNPIAIPLSQPVWLLLIGLLLFGLAYLPSPLKG